MKLFFDMQIVDEFGHVHARMRREISRDAAFIGEREVDDMKAGLVSFDSAIKVMRVRELRKTLLMDAAQNCGAALAEHLEDREGWHGIERAERIRAQYPKMEF